MDNKLPMGTIMQANWNRMSELSKMRVLSKDDKNEYDCRRIFQECFSEGIDTDDNIKKAVLSMFRVRNINRNKYISSKKMININALLIKE